MPAMLEDPTAPVIYRTSGAPPYPTPNNPQIPPTIIPRQVTLRDRITIATLIPFSHPSQCPPSLLNYLCSQLNLEIEKGDTYPMMVPMPVSSFGPYWFQNFAAVMLLGEINSVEDVVRMEQRRTNWEKICLGSFYVKPNYPGRSSHVCNGGFLVTDAARNRGVGRLMGEGYLEWAPKLGYTYSVFNLVYETNLASCRIWDALGFKRIGRVKACGNLASHPDELVDAIIYGRDLGPEGEDFVSEERFDKIRFYLKHGKYPNGADRAGKSRLRSAATHYKLLEGEGGEERLMLKDKEVVSDPQRQYEIARQKHAEQHGGINKTTAAIAEQYHWVRIKETVSLAIKNCPQCKDATKIPTVRPADGESLPHSPSAETATISARPQRKAQGQKNTNGNHSAQDPNALIERLVNFDDPDTATPDFTSQHDLSQQHQPEIYNNQHQAPVASMQALQHQLEGQLQQELQGYTSSVPLDPQIITHSHGHPNTGYHPYDPDTDVGQRQHAPDDQLISDTYDGAQDVGHDGHYELDMSDLQDVGGDDTRMATARHVVSHDEPMAFIQRGHQGNVGTGGGDENLFGE